MHLMSAIQFFSRRWLCSSSFNCIVFAGQTSQVVCMRWILIRMPNTLLPTGWHARRMVTVEPYTQPSVACVCKCAIVFCNKKKKEKLTQMPNRAESETSNACGKCACIWHGKCWTHTHGTFYAPHAIVVLIQIVDVEQAAQKWEYDWINSTHMGYTHTPWPPWYCLVRIGKKTRIH